MNPAIHAAIIAASNQEAIEERSRPDCGRPGRWVITLIFASLIASGAALVMAGIL